MVELRKRPPPKEPPAPAPAAKKRASNSTAKGKGQSVVGKAKAAASKVKAAVTKGPEAETAETSNATTESKALQPSVEDESTAEKGQAGLVPETTAAAPTTVTVPDEASNGTAETKDAAPAATATADDEANRSPATEDLENPPETGKIETVPVTSGEGASLPLSTASVGKSIPSLDSFGGSIKTHSGTSTTFATLLSSCKTGVIIFTYPKASTPGCTQQACMFRDNFPEFQDKAGYTIYGLSADSPKANSNFVAKQNLQYELLCDEAASLTGAIGMKKPGNAKGTLRGVVVVDKDGVVRVWFQGGPAKTVDVVKDFLASKN